MHADAWAALGACVGAGFTGVTAVIAGLAARFALRQVREARITREEQAQPNVVAFTRPNAKVYSFLDLVVANYGLTPAYHIKLEFQPPLTVSPHLGATGQTVTHLHLPDEIAVLAPGQEWVTMWDAATERYNKRDELGSRFEGLVRYDDSRGMIFENRAILDWDTHFDTMYVADKPDESAKAVAGQLSEIGKILKSYQTEHDGIWIYPVPADEQRNFLQERAARAKAVHDHITRALHGGQEPSQPAPQTPAETTETP